MRTLNAILVLVAMSGASLPAQSAPDVSGRWEGELPIPNNPVAVVFDLTRDSSGALAGTFGQPAQHLQGLPLAVVLVEGRTVTLAAREDQPFSGTLSDDGKTIEGVLSSMGYDIPLSLTRTGDAHVEPAVASPAVDARFAGVWRGAAGQTELLLKIVNNPDGTATAEFENISEGGLRVPVRTIAADDAHLTLEIPAVGGSYAGEVNADGTEITGVYREGQAQGPLTFSKAR